MESVDLAMDDIFDGGLAEDDLAIPPPLPDLDDDMPVGGEDGGALNTSGQDTEAANTDKTPKSAVKKRVLRPQPKLDSERLQSERGLPMLPKLFSNTQFKGKGHEADDLKLVMGRLEHWAHRLFPKLTFDDFTARLEKLGRTKAVQTCIKRIRLDMPIAGEDFTGNPNNNEDGSGNEDNDAGGGTDVPQDSTMDVEEAYEEMLRQERQQVAQLKTTTPGGTAGNHPLTSAADSSSVVEFSPRQLPDGTPSKSAGAASPTRSSTGLSPQNTPYTTTAGSQISMTPEQLARIERNKQLAVQKRAVRLGVHVSSLLSPKPAMKVTRETSEGDAVTPTVTTSTPLCHQLVSDIAITTVAVTTDVDMNTHVSDSCDGGAQAGDKEGKMSDKDHAVIENTGVQDRAINKCKTDGTTMQTEEEILDALESDHNDDCPDASVAKDDSCVDTSVEHISGQTKSATNGTSEKNSSDLQTSAGAAEVVR